MKLHKITMYIRLTSLLSTFYDTNNKRVGTATGVILNLAKGDTKTVDFATFDDLAATKYVKFQVDAQY